ncbi:cAMP-responsive element-binding protein-like 2 [Dreissena polymorpha]|uniref:BZIP domain-containing protein n=1 Tax=Dreissena polymorpha TaxID=45954 RepID=A0A9D4NMJ7_DREPO|nr:cAMP-responsive element-binding protein-like 2 [Dreissena polymorpha]KAH3897071.1 hypothetical protein DPMN_021255 [Dreissena polymorpha]
MNIKDDTENCLRIDESPEYTELKQEEEASTSGMSGDRPSRKAGRRVGRKSSKMDVRAKLERSRQSARECRARKKLRYQYLEDLVANREKAVFALRDELEMWKTLCREVDDGKVSTALKDQLLPDLDPVKAEPQD